MIRPATPRNWADFQHYRNRRPPWIKLHRAILDDYEFSCLPIASKALAPLLWLIASEGENGTVDVEPGRLAHRLRWTYDEIIQGLDPLIEGGFIILASVVIAPRLQLASAEGEREREREGEGEEGSHSSEQTADEKKNGRTFKRWLESLPEGEDAIPGSDPVFAYAMKAGIPSEFLGLSWAEFHRRMSTNGKRYKSWPKAYRNYVENNYFDLWRINDNGDYVLTAKGQQAKKVNS
jgi:hypothetical protein